MGKKAKLFSPQNNIGYVFNGEKFEAKPKEYILGDLFDKHLDNIDGECIAFAINRWKSKGFSSIDNYISESDVLQTKIQNNVVLDKIVNNRLPKFIEDLNKDKYRTEKINDLKLLTYNKSDIKVLKNNLE